MPSLATLKIAAETASPSTTFIELAGRQAPVTEWAKYLFEQKLGWKVAAEDKLVLKALREWEKTTESAAANYLLLSAKPGAAPVVFIEIDARIELEHVPTARRLHAIVSAISQVRATLGHTTAVGICCNQTQLLILDPARTRDHRFVLSAERLRTLTRSRDALEDLSATRLKTFSRFGQTFVDYSRFFEEVPFDQQFLQYLDDYRRCVIEEIVGQPTTVNSLLKLLLPSSRYKTLPKYSANATWVAECLEDVWIKESLLAATDTYLLRQILHQFIEAYHGVVIQPSHQVLLESYADKKVVGGGVVGTRARGSSRQNTQNQYRFTDPFVLRAQEKTSFKSAFLKLDTEYAHKYRGDVHFSQLARAVELLEAELSPDTIAEALDLLSQKRYSFRYSDIRPEIIETYYQKSLSTDIEISFNKQSKTFEVEATESNFARKRGGAYFTKQHLAEFTSREAVAKLIELRTSLIRAEIERKAWPNATRAFDAFLEIKICDPTVGGGSFVKEAFRQISSQFDSLISMFRLFPDITRGTLSRKHTWLRSSSKDPRGEFENYILTNMLYGVDIDLKALCIASQTLTLESLRYLRDEEAFPNFINVNFKQGSAFAPVFMSDEWKNVPAGKIKKLLEIRSQARNADDISKLHKLFSKEARIIQDLSATAIKTHCKAFGSGYSLLRPFAWHIEFPEVFFNADGTPKASPGFDVIIGNPPWEAIAPNYDEFFSRRDPEWPSGKNAGSEKKQRRIDYLLKHQPDLKAEFEEYMSSIESMKAFVDSEQYYTLQKPQFEKIRGTGGDNNTWKLAAELYPKLLNGRGRFGFLLPSGFCGDKGARDLRVSFISEDRVELVVGFNKDNEFFDATQGFCVIVGGLEAGEPQIRYRDGLRTLQDLSSLRTESIPAVDKSVVLDLTSEVKPLVEVRDETEARIIEKIRKFPSPLKSNEPWRVEPTRELHTGDDNDLETSTDTGYRLAKGEDCGRYCFTAPKRFLKFREFEKRFGNRLDISVERVVWRKIAGTNDPRRMQATLLPPRVAGYDSCTVVKPEQSREEKRILVALLNSTVYEWYIRKQSKNNNVSVFLIREAPLPRPDKTSTHSKKLCQLVDNILSKSSKTDKARTEAEIDAIVAAIYGLNEREYRFVLQSFEKLEPSFLESCISYFSKARKAG